MANSEKPRFSTWIDFRSRLSPFLPHHQPFVPTAIARIYDVNPDVLPGLFGYVEHRGLQIHVDPQTGLLPRDTSKIPRGEWGRLQEQRRADIADRGYYDPPKVDFKGKLDPFTGIVEATAKPSTYGWWSLHPESPQAQEISRMTGVSVLWLTTQLDGSHKVVLAQRSRSNHSYNGQLNAGSTGGIESSYQRIPHPNYPNGIDVEQKDGTVVHHHKSILVPAQLSQKDFRQTAIAESYEELGLPYEYLKAVSTDPTLTPDGLPKFFLSSINKVNGHTDGVIIGVLGISAAEIEAYQKPRRKHAAPGEDPVDPVLFAEIADIPKILTSIPTPLAGVSAPGLLDVYALSVFQTTLKDAQQAQQSSPHQARIVALKSARLARAELERDYKNHQVRIETTARLTNREGIKAEIRNLKSQERYFQLMEHLGKVPTVDDVLAYEHKHLRIISRDNATALVQECGHEILRRVVYEKLALQFRKDQKNSPHSRRNVYPTKEDVEKGLEEALKHPEQIDYIPLSLILTHQFARIRQQLQIAHLRGKGIDNTKPPEDQGLLSPIEALKRIGVYQEVEPAFVLKEPRTAQELAEDPLAHTVYMVYPQDGSIHENPAYLQQKREYVIEFLKNYPGVTEVWEKGGLLESEDSYNIVRHCITAGVYASIFARELGLSEEDTQNLVYAALVHDWFKLQENRMMDEEITKSGKLTPQSLDKIKKVEEVELREILTSLNLPPGRIDSIVHIAGSNIPKAQDSILTTPEGHLTEKIMWFVDASLYDEWFYPAEYRFKVDRAGEKRRSVRARLRDDAYQERYERPYAELQLEINSFLRENFQRLLVDNLNISNHQLSDLPAYFKTLYISQIMKMSRSQQEPHQPALAGTSRRSATSIN